MPMHLRGETCSLRGAFLRWIPFSAGLPIASLFMLLVLFLSRNTPDVPLFIAIFLILLGPEAIAFFIAERSVPGYRQWNDDYITALALALFAVRSCIVFMWGVSRLQRGNRAPYAETLWLLVASAFVVVWVGRFAPADQTTFYILAAVAGIAATVIFVFQRRRPPAWTWKIPE